MLNVDIITIANRMCISYRLLGYCHVFIPCCVRLPATKSCCCIHEWNKTHRKPVARVFYQATVDLPH